MTGDIEAMRVPSGSLAIIGLFVVYLFPMVLMRAFFIPINHILKLELALSTLQIYAVYAASCWITFLIMLLLLWRQGLRLRDIGYRGDMDLSTIGVALLFFVTGLTVLAISGFVLDCAGIRWSSSLDIKITRPIDAALLVFTLLVTSPIIEDTFYRAYSITILESKLGNRWVAGLASCFMFALLHLPFWGVRGSIHLFLWALLSTALFVWRKSIYPCLLMHVANNVFMYVLFPMLVVD